MLNLSHTTLKFHTAITFAIVRFEAFTVVEIQAEFWVISP